MAVHKFVLWKTHISYSHHKQKTTNSEPQGVTLFTAELGMEFESNIEQTARRIYLLTILSPFGVQAHSSKSDGPDDPSIPATTRIQLCSATPCFFNLHENSMNTFSHLKLSTNVIIHQTIPKFVTFFFSLKFN